MIINHILGLDIGSNSVGSAWVDTENKEITVGVSVFPSGVDETDDKRGAPKNQDRRSKRTLRRTLARRSQRKRQTREILTQFRLLPTDQEDLRTLFNIDPWPLRRRGLDEPLTANEFGRVLVHLGQRRGAVGFDSDIDDEGTVKKAMTRVELTMLGRYGSDAEKQTAQNLREQIDALSNKKRTAEETEEYDQACEQLKALSQSVMRHRSVTFGRLMADLMEERRHDLSDEQGNQKIGPKGNPSHYNNPIRNRLDSFEFHADRTMIRDEFLHLWKRQSEPGGALSHLSEKERQQLKQALDDPERDGTWRHKGHLFGQRNTYWDTGTLGRCDLEPTDRCVPITDRHASYYRVIESVNNIRIKGPNDRTERPLTSEERAKVIDRLRSQKAGTVAGVRAAMEIDKQSLKKQDLPANAWSLNIENDEDREINTDWFHREIVLGAIGEETWNDWPEQKKEGLNRAILKCDPAVDDDADRLRKIATNLELDSETADRLITAWQTRPKLEKRLNLSRSAILNLLPYMERQLPDGRWPTQIEARRMFADDLNNTATSGQRRRYRIGSQTLTKDDLHFLKKHPNELPPAPTLSNPVVRKAIHEVRRHVIAHIRAHNGEKPDRVVIEFARETNKSKKLSDWILTLNRKRERIRKNIIEEVVKPAFGSRFQFLSHNQVHRAIDRVILARQQKNSCAYSGTQFIAITDRVAACGDGLEIDHVIPYSRCGNNSWSNRVLCWQKSNRDKGKKTPREWWGEDFDNNSRPIAFMDGFEPAKGDPNEYFTKSDYTAKWKNFSSEDIPNQWRGSQLTDTAYAARQVHSYLQNALWPDQPSHLEGGQRRIFVTKGSYTHQLRKDWQLFQKTIDPSQDTQEDVQQASAKNRGDHREHALDAVVIALIGEPGSVSSASEDRLTTRIDDLAHYRQKFEEEQLQAKLDGRDPRELKRDPLPPSWGNVKTFRRHVLSKIYGDFDELDGSTESHGDDESSMPIVVSHRPVGRRITGAFHKDTLFGPIPISDDKYVGRTWIYKNAQKRLKPAHLRLPLPEKKKDSIVRLAQEYLDNGVETSKQKARKRAKTVVESPEFTAPLVDPPPAKGGLVRDLDLRERLRECIASFEYTEKDCNGNITVRYRLDPDNFKAKEIKQAYEKGGICHESGVPIKRVKLLRTMTDPIVVHRKKWDGHQQKWVRDTGKDGELKPDEVSRADRAYDSQNNHHVEIRQNETREWTGVIIPTFVAARRVRIEGQEAVDRSDDPEKGGRFVMSLAEGETVYMTRKDTDKPDYFVVFKLDKPQQIQFKHHWDARRAKGENDEDGNLIPNSKREPIPVSATKLRDLAPPGHEYPVKVRVSPLGQITPLFHD